MVLRVSLEEFPATVRRILSQANAYTTAYGVGTLITAADPARNLLIASTSQSPPDEVKRILEDQDFEVFSGSWKSEEMEIGEPRTPIYVAAVAYKSRDATPGLWVDCYPHHPTQADVLRGMYDEFVATGDIKDVTFDDFFKLSHPNVVILPPEDVESFARKKIDC